MAITRIKRTTEYNQRTVLESLDRAKKDGFDEVYYADLLDYVEEVDLTLSKRKDFKTILDDLESESEISSHMVNNMKFYSLTPLGQLRVRHSEEDYMRILSANYVNQRIKKETIPAKGTDSDEKDLQLLSVYRAKAFDSYGERREALILEDLDENTLEEDIKNGAYPFSKLGEYSDLDIPSRVVLIRARTLEDGLKAVCYFFAIQNPGIDRDSYVCAESFDLKNYEPFEEQSIPNVLPIVSAGEINHSNGFGAGMGNFGFSEVGNCCPSRPKWWEDHEGSIIIFNRDAFYLGKDYLCDALDHVVNTNKEHIYVISIENGIEDSEDDIPYGTSQYLKAIVQYCASAFDIVANDFTEYRKKVFQGLCHKTGLDIPQNFPINEFLDRLDRVVPDMQAEFLENLLIREYLKKESRELSPDLLKLLGRLDSDNSNSRLKGWDLLDSLDSNSIRKTKTELRALLNSMKLNKARKNRGLKTEPIIACLFTGCPGTSKSTCARALADILFEEKLLPSNKFISVTGSGLQAEYVGQTSGKVRSIVEDNSVIFIDEAYSLSQSKDMRSPYAAEALAELCVLMTEAAEKGNKLFIFAGYGGAESSSENNLMKEFLETNPGIKSRISTVINFPSYDEKTMANIFLKICKNDGFTFSDKETNALKTEVAEYFRERLDDPSFGNGREAANLVSESLRMHAETLDGKAIDEISDEELQTLTITDVRKAIASLRKMELARSGKGAKKISLVG